MIALPVTVDSGFDAYFIVDATGRIVADNITRSDDAEQICQALNKTKGNENE